MKHTLEQIQTEVAQLLARTGASVVLWHDPHGAYAEDALRVQPPAGTALLREEDTTIRELLARVNAATAQAPLVVYRRRFHDIAEGDLLADLEACAPRISCEAEAEAGADAAAHGRHELIAPLAAALTEDWYTPEDFSCIVAEHAPSGLGSTASALAAQLGFSWHEGCVVRSTWATPNAYYRSLLTGPLVPRSSIDQKILASQGFAAYVDLLQEQMEMLAYDDSTWITKQGLEELGIAREDLVQFGRDVTALCDAEGTCYGTLPWLKRSGAPLKLLRYELADAFYEHVLRLRRLGLGSGSICGVPFFSVHNAQPSGRAFVEHLVRQEVSIALEGLLERMQEDFGIPLTRARLIALVRQTNLFFSPEADRVYIDHDQFIREME